jgi:hypothetical protein
LVLSSHHPGEKVGEEGIIDGYFRIAVKARPSYNDTNKQGLQLFYD